MTDWIKNLMDSMGYFGIALLMFLENVFPPIPSELIMPFAGFTAQQGKMTFIGVTIAGALGSLAGQLPLYYLGKVVGKERLKRWADRHGHWLTLSGEDIEKADAWFRRHGGKAVLLGRVVPGVRSLISIPAGFADMNLPLFLLYSGIGTAVWAGFLAYLGGLLGRNYETVGKYLGPATYVVLGLLLLTVIVQIVRRKKAGAGEGAQAR